MNIHEYQAKEILREYDIPLLQGFPAFTAAEAKEAAQKLGGDLWVVKAQIHAGGRGKAGGIVIAKTLDEVTNAAQKLLNKPLVTHQTGPQGQTVHRLYVEKGCTIAREFYVSLLTSPTSGRLALVASAGGGVDIETRAKENPQQILTQFIDPVVGLSPFHVRRMGFAFGLEKEALLELDRLLQGLYQAFYDKDAHLIEINPLVLTQEGHLLALDTKMTFDDNGLYRHPEILALRDTDEENVLEIEASRSGLSYIKLDGSIGCMVNGAGLAMATMDLIKLHGAEPANFLDVGGGADQQKVSAAFRIILRDPNVKAILVNIFGGIMRCDIIAEGIIAAAREIALSLPMVVRLQGTHSELGKKILKESGLKIVSVDTLEEAALEVVQAAGNIHGYSG